MMPVHWLGLACAFAADASAAEAPLDSQMERGRTLYFQNCLACHQLAGQGSPGAIPPLAKPDYLMADKDRSIRILCEGISGEMRVNGRRYDSAMPPVTLQLSYSLPGRILELAVQPKRP